MRRLLVLQPGDWIYNGELTIIPCRGALFFLSDDTRIGEFGYDSETIELHGAHAKIMTDTQFQRM